ncbi:MAG: patatin-like phospholipase family protein, partial [Kiloniellales bacterium]|nr:patatin-like phospholipase family protein [Kiloniellales bacterium]
MGKNRLVVLSGLVAALLLVSCASVPERELSDKSPLYAALPTGYDPIDLTQFSRMYTVSTSGSGENAIRHLERQHKRPLNILSLSGGGQNGAFGAGFLIGWRERGDRPKFDIVFGVSTGALLATHAFLGTPADDAKLEEMYTEVTKEDIYSDRGIFDLLQGTDSLRDTTPLRALIAKYVTVETLERVAAASDEKRILGVGTTNIDYGQTWIWNMSMIAKAGDVELYRKVLLASSAFPIVFPPVEIDGHLFVDGAARSNVVVVGMGGRTKPEPPPYGPGNVYLIDNGRLNHPPEALRRAIGDVAATTIGVMLNQA